MEEHLVFAFLLLGITHQGVSALGKTKRTKPPNSLFGHPFFTEISLVVSTKCSRQENGKERYCEFFIYFLYFFCFQQQQIFILRGPLKRLSRNAGGLYLNLCNNQMWLTCPSVCLVSLPTSLSLWVISLSPWEYGSTVSTSRIHL